MLLSRELSSAFVAYAFAWIAAIASPSILFAFGQPFLGTVLFFGIPLTTLVVRKKYFTVHRHEPLILIGGFFLFWVYLALGTPFYLHYVISENIEIET